MLSTTFLKKGTCSISYAGLCHEGLSRECGLVHVDWWLVWMALLQLKGTALTKVPVLACPSAEAGG